MSKQVIPHVLTWKRAVIPFLRDAWFAVKLACGLRLFLKCIQPLAFLYQMHSPQNYRKFALLFCEIYSSIQAGPSYRQGCSANKKGVGTHPKTSHFKTASMPVLESFIEMLGEVFQKTVRDATTGVGNGNGLLFHMTQPISRSTIKAIACSKPTISEH